MNCSHITKVLEWGFSENHEFTVALWGCVLCDATSDKPFKDEDNIEVDHTACGPDCFGCKAKGLQLNAGDATRDISKKAWNSRLNGYANAKAQGIQPGGTTPEKVRAAYEASETLNRPYNAEKMPAAHKVNDKVAEVMKEVGI
jgi:hypothetical protein